MVVEGELFIEVEKCGQDAVSVRVVEVVQVRVHGRIGGRAHALGVRFLFL